MKLYISEEKFNEIDKLSKFEIVPNYEDADSIVIVPGGLSSLSDMFNSIIDKKDVYVYNKDLFYSKIFDVLYNLYTSGVEKKAPSDYMKIESDLDRIVERLEEKEHGKNNDGESGKLL